MDRRWKAAIIAAAVLVVGLGAFFFPAASSGFALIVVPIALFAIAIATKKPIWWFAAIAVAVIAGALFLASRDSDDARERREDRAGQPVEQHAEQRGVEGKPTRTIEVIAQPGVWSENFSVPPNHWCRIMPHGKVKVKTWDGREIDDEPGKDTWLGHEVLDANFRFMSREDTSVVVTIVLQPK